MVTIVAFHAHPDDEVLLTGGTIARLAAEGHRVIIVVACDGAMWDGPDHGRRLEELRTSAVILGVDKAVHLGYAGSGHGPVLFEDPPGRTRFARADVEEAATTSGCTMSARGRPRWLGCGSRRRRCRASWPPGSPGRCSCVAC